MRPRPSELDAAVVARVPARIDHDDRQFTDRFQAMPKADRTRMFENMLPHEKIRVLLNTDYRDVVSEVKFRRMIYARPVDAFFDHRYRPLPYCSLESKFETRDRETFQLGAAVNDPNDHAYARVTESTYLSRQVHPTASGVDEFPRADGDPYYPVPRPADAELYRRYNPLADARHGVEFVGRLATCEYHHINPFVGQALAVFDRTCGVKPFADSFAA